MGRRNERENFPWNWGLAAMGSLPFPIAWLLHGLRRGAHAKGQDRLSHRSHLRQVAIVSLALAILPLGRALRAWPDVTFRHLP